MKRIFNLLLSFAIAASFIPASTASDNRKASQSRKSSKAKVRASKKQERAVELNEFAQLPGYRERMKQGAFVTQAQLSMTLAEIAFWTPLIIHFSSLSSTHALTATRNHTSKGNTSNVGTRTAVHTTEVNSGETILPDSLPCNRNDTSKGNTSEGVREKAIPKAKEKPAEKPREKPEVMTQVSNCGAFVEPGQLPIAEEERIQDWRDALNTMIPAVHESLSVMTMCRKNHTLAEHMRIVKDFDSRIAPVVVSHIKQSRSQGKKIGFIVGTIQDSCSMLYQELRLNKLLNFYNITTHLVDAPEEMVNTALSLIDNGGVIDTEEGLRTFLSPKPDLSRVAYKRAYGFKLAGIDNMRRKAKSVYQFANDVQELDQQYTSLENLKNNPDCQMQQLYSPTKEELDRKRAVLHNCSDFFHVERYLAARIRQTPEDFSFSVGYLQLGPLLTLLRNDSHSLLMIRLANEPMVLSTGTLSGYVSRGVIPQKCADKIMKYLDTLSSTTRRRPCILQSELDRELLIK